ncbi:hypothetical protein DFP72DRAFT_841902 [Ephemerocybe angulata]|uniref:Uncharacterized protein n=1 Tax=Ephemerocybe angulata TaxID=980116 RepID=A0A8H6IFE2_9AGAR|nr:hypothetical protein DFP72DRAFT_841902 [Tulosesus angulatus]
MAGSGVAKSPPMKMNIVRGTPSQLTAFLVLNIWTSHAGLPFLLAVVLLAKGVKRHPTFANLCIAFMIIGLVYGSATSGPEPPPVLCLLQASLLYGMPTFFHARLAGCGSPITASHTTTKTMFYGCGRTHYRWDWGWTTRTRLTKSTLLLLLGGKFATVGLPLQNRAARFLSRIEIIAWSIFILVRHRILVKPKGNQPPVNLDLSLPIRIMIFGLYLILAMSLSFLSVSSPSSPVPDLAIATAGSVVILIFGTQRDILRALCFWKRNRRRVIHIEPDIVTPDLRTAFDEVKKQAERR